MRVAQERSRMRATPFPGPNRSSLNLRDASPRFNSIVFCCVPFYSILHVLKMGAGILKWIASRCTWYCRQIITQLPDTLITLICEFDNDIWKQFSQIVVKSRSQGYSANNGIYLFFSGDWYHWLIKKTRKRISVYLVNSFGLVEISPRCLPLFVCWDFGPGYTIPSRTNSTPMLRSKPYPPYPGYQSPG